MFNVDFNILIKRLLPIALRQPKFIDWLMTAFKGLRDIYSEFIQFRNDTTYWLYFNGQIIYLEHVLNDQFDPVNRGIYIENLADIQYDYLYNAIEQRTPVYLDNKSENKPPDYFVNQSEYDNHITFIVWVPATVTFNINKMKAIVNKYRIAGKTYQIQTY